MDDVPHMVLWRAGDSRGASWACGAGVSGGELGVHGAASGGREPAEARGAADQHQLGRAALLQRTAASLRAYPPGPCELQRSHVPSRSWCLDSPCHTWCCPQHELLSSYRAVCDERTRFEAEVTACETAKAQVRTPSPPPPLLPLPRRTADRMSACCPSGGRCPAMTRHSFKHTPTRRLGSWVCSRHAQRRRSKPSARRRRTRVRRRRSWRACPGSLRHCAVTWRWRRSSTTA